MEKQWQYLLEVAWCILDGKSKEKRGGQSLQELKETDRLKLEAHRWKTHTAQAQLRKEAHSLAHRELTSE